MSSLVFALIRHGDYHQLPDTPSAHQPFALTEHGKQQARQCASELASYCDRHALKVFPELLSSHLLRAWQTTDEICQALNLPGYSIQQTTELAERSVGLAGNLTLNQISDVLAQDPRYPAPPDDWKSNSHFRLPFAGAESLMESGQRVARFLQQRQLALTEQTPEHCLQIIVGHGAAIRHAAHLLGILSFDDIARFSMYHCKPVYLTCNKNNHWQHIDGDWKIRHTRDKKLD